MVVGSTIDCKGRMPHAQARMTASLDVAGWTAKAENQEIAQALFCSSQIVLWIQPAQNVILGDSPVKRRDKPLKSLFADRRKYFRIIHNADSNMTCCTQHLVLKAVRHLKQVGALRALLDESVSESELSNPERVWE